jgi:hypothetical protein
MIQRRFLPRLALAGGMALALTLALLPGSTGCRSNDPLRTIPKVPYEVASGQAQRPVLAQTLADALVPEQTRPNATVAPVQNMIAISGGGQYAAYNAGMLVGWTATGTRPTFDVVTGISSGAIVAAYAFLGPKYDERMKQFFTTINDKDLFKYRPFGILRRGSIATPEKLEAIIAREANDEFFADMRQAHSEGRRLYLGTMNARTRRVTIWDVGAIACSGRPDAEALVKKIFLAATSIPGLLPPVEFDVCVGNERYIEEHVDGGAASQVFLRLGPQSLRPADRATGWLSGSNLYIMTAGKLYAPALEGDIGLLKRVTSTISAALYALYRSEVLSLYAFCGVSGMNFNLIAVPEEDEVPPNSMTFDSKAMTKLFAEGYCVTQQGAIPWRRSPTGAEPGEEESPRERLDGITIHQGK